MFPITSGATAAYLANLDRNQQATNQTQSQVSSGIRVQQPADDPSAVAEILQVQTGLAQNNQVQTNLTGVQSELGSADSALQAAVQAVENAVSVGAQGASSTATADQRASLAQQVAGLQQTLVGISQTQFNGRYIFSGDLDTQPAYQVDSTQPTGVKQLISAPATRQIVDASGVPITVARTAQQIFDARDSTGAPATGNVFAAVNALLTALQSNNQAGVSQAVDSLNSAGQHLNDQLALYGDAENQVAGSLDLAQKFQTQQQASLSNLRDTNIPAAAIQLNQEQLQQQAALSSEASLLQQKNLFSYIA
jgi:flagellar hook-associated protein 3 FlgL